MRADINVHTRGAALEAGLSLQQKRQATLLYHWMSLDYLKALKTLIDALLHGVDVDLELAKQQGRDILLTNDRWGVRDTATNWSTFVYSSLEDFRKATIKDIALRAVESYEFTGANQCSRMIEEHSSLWMTPDEEQRFKKQWEKVYRYAGKVDSAAGTGGARNLDDFAMVMAWEESRTLFPRLPKLRVRTDVFGVSGKRPPRTGVYVAQDDPHATLQFAWTGNGDGVIGQARTFNDIGLRALAAVGRDALWVDGSKMAAFASDAFRRGEVTDRHGFDVDDEKDPRWAGTIVSMQSFVKRPTDWYFVEMIDGESDEEDGVENTNEVVATRLRCAAGQPCPREGWWFTPSKANSRRPFHQGEVMPAFTTDYGATHWQWDEHQG
ncbi:hypothetical protein [Ideonella sp. BN130291]|uniref:hypothetical protein n=1 Tax=Ideonella sp. BN130291 TaxID=3112940 RepID=UPI002E255F37|nr:hypothetical protein [Ideonella sp. BN130291]